MYGTGVVCVTVNSIYHIVRGRTDKVSFTVREVLGDGWVRYGGSGVGNTLTKLYKLPFYGRRSEYSLLLDPMKPEAFSNVKLFKVCSTQILHVLRSARR